MRRTLQISLVLGVVAATLLAWLWTPWALLLVLVPLDLMLWATLAPGCEWWGPVLRSFGSRFREVLLTFDGSPHPDETQEALVLLERYGARALFMVDAERAERYPELVREIVHRGHGVGCSLTDAQAAKYWRMSPRQLESAIQRSCQVLRSVLPDVHVQWLRVPGEIKLPWLHPILDRAGLKLISASADDGGPLMADMERALLRMRSAIGKGGVIQFHHGQRDAAGHNTMPEMLEETLLWLRGQGYGMS